MKTKKNAAASLEKKRPYFFLIGLVTALSLILVAFEWRTAEYKVTIPDGEYDDNYEPDEVLPPIVMKSKPSLPAPKSKKKSRKIDITKVNIEPKEKGLELTPKLEDSEYFLDEEPLGSEPDIPVPPRNYAEIMPMFPGGEEAMFKYLANNINYPEYAKSLGITGKLSISFVVDKKGNISDIKINGEGLKGGCNEEAIRVVKNMPTWIAGRQAGKPVAVRYNLPISFVLRN